MRNVAILIFNDVEVLDFSGPFEVFSVAGGHGEDNTFRVFTVAEDRRPIWARGGLAVNPAFSLEDCPTPHIMVVPGGRGTHREKDNPLLLKWIRQRSESAELILSVCTGSLILANAGLLEGLAATTHHTTLDLLRDLAPHSRIYSDRRFVDNGRIITSAGISAGIDMSLHVVARLLGQAKAEETAHHMEYEWCEASQTTSGDAQAARG